MDKINFKEKLKDKKVYIPLIIIGILIVILILFLVGNVVSKITASKEKKYVSSAQEVSFVDELGTDANRKEVTVSANNGDKCVDSICVTSIKILCYDDRGVINFTVKNNSSSTSNGDFLRIVIGEGDNAYSAVIWYDKVEPGQTVDGFHSYFGYDLRGFGSSKYKVEELSDEDITSLSKFKYTEDENNVREYTEIGYTDPGYDDE